MPNDLVPSLIGVLVNWAPMLLLIGVWVYFMRKYLGGRRGGMTNNEYLALLLQEEKRHNEALEKILVRLEQRLK